MPSRKRNEDERAGRLDRRKFAKATVKAGLAASAAVWVAPQISTVALAQTTAGSPPPSTSTTTPTTSQQTTPTTPSQKATPKTPKKNAQQRKNVAAGMPAAPPAPTPVVAPPNFTD
jgi:hypothetical protein